MTPRSSIFVKRYSLKEKLVAPSGRTAVDTLVSTEINAVISPAGIVDALSAADMVAWKSNVTTRPAMVVDVVVVEAVVGGAVSTTVASTVVVGAIVVEVVGATVVFGLVLRVGSFSVVVVAFSVWPPCVTGLRMGTDVVVLGCGTVVVVDVVVDVDGSVVVAICSVVEVDATSSVSPTQDLKVKMRASSIAMIKP